MKFLLDSHVLLWWCADGDKLSRRARDAIASPSSAVYVSVVSGWELTIKTSLGRLKLAQAVEDAIEAYQFEPLLLTFAHVRRVSELPYHHRDPFDRMLVAQAVVEDLTVVTKDREIARYEVRTLW
jgi:PIN domain nuclease of toxin-antitoxin system